MIELVKMGDGQTGASWKNTALFPYEALDTYSLTGFSGVKFWVKKLRGSGTRRQGPYDLF